MNHEMRLVTVNPKHVDDPSWFATCACGWVDEEGGQWSARNAADQFRAHLAEVVVPKTFRKGENMGGFNAPAPEPPGEVVDIAYTGPPPVTVIGAPTREELVAALDEYGMCRWPEGISCRHQPKLAWNPKAWCSLCRSVDDILRRARGGGA